MIKIIRRNRGCINVSKGKSKPLARPVKTDLSLADIIELLKQGEIIYGNDSSSLSDIIQCLDAKPKFRTVEENKNLARSNMSNQIHHAGLADLYQEKALEAMLQQDEDTRKKLQVIGDLREKHSCVGKFKQDRECHICRMLKPTVYETCYDIYISSPDNVDLEFKKIMPKKCSQMGYENCCELKLGDRSSRRCSPRVECIVHIKD